MHPRPRSSRARQSTSWTDPALEPGASYSYRVRGTGRARATSDYSPPAQVVMPPRGAATPIEPLGVQAEAVSATAVLVSWTARDPQPAASVIQRSVGWNPWHPATWSAIATTTVGVTSFVDAGLSAGSAYLYRVRATRGGAESAALDGHADDRSADAAPDAASHVVYPLAPTAARGGMAFWLATAVAAATHHSWARILGPHAGSQKSGCSW